MVCFDAKINFDDNAEFRQKSVFAMDDMSESDPLETEAAKWDLKYIGLDGNIACFGMKTNFKRFFLFVSLLPFTAGSPRPHRVKDLRCTDMKTGGSDTTVETCVVPVVLYDLNSTRSVWIETQEQNLKDKHLWIPGVKRA